jgi:hypothetical protein
MMIYLVGIAAVTAVLLCLTISAYLCRSYKKSLLGKVKAFKKKFIWNGFFRGLQISYLK